jgi:uncharacterized repeat protein (TIGR03803 family)
MRETRTLRTLASVVGICALALIATAARGGVMLSNLFTFNGSDGNGPQVGLLAYTNGSFLGTTWEGGAGGTGTVFAVTGDGTLTTLVTFYGTNGGHPCAGLTLASDGNFYGMTGSGGTSNWGTIFRTTLDGTATVLVSFLGTNGVGPAAGIIQASDGNFYGTTELGGANNRGTIFKMTPGGSLTTLYSFDPTNGCSPEAPLLQAQDGNFYGTTTVGGLFDGGTVFKMTPDGSVTFLTSFAYSNGCPVGRLVQGDDGALYGATAGWSLGGGSVYRITTNRELTTLVAFDVSGVNGLNPDAGLTLASDGNFYGTCTIGGTSNRGTIFRVTPNGMFKTVYNFSGGSDGMVPVTELLQAADGNLYGTTYYGGPSWAGNVFSLSVPMPPVLQPPRLDSGLTCMTWSSVAGQTYQLQFSPDLESSNWTDLGLPVVATNGVMSDCHSTGTDSERFYRVRLLP